MQKISSSEVSVASCNQWKVYFFPGFNVHVGLAALMILMPALYLA
jgi:hypothetical protein